MKRLLFAVFPDRRAARDAESELRDHFVSARVHEGDIDLMLGVDLANTRSQGALERSVAGRFGAAFGICAVLGVAIDALLGLAESGLMATMALGSFGVLVGTLAVLGAAMRPLDAAIAEARKELDTGSVLLTIPIAEDDALKAASTVGSHGGHTLFDA